MDNDYKKFSLYEQWQKETGLNMFDGSGKTFNIYKEWLEKKISAHKKENKELKNKFQTECGKCKDHKECFCYNGKPIITQKQVEELKADKETWVTDSNDLVEIGKYEQWTEMKKTHISIEDTCKMILNMSTEARNKISEYDLIYNFGKRLRNKLSQKGV